MNQYLYDDDNLFWVFTEEEPDQLKTLFSRYEEYSLYLGFNRSITNPPNRDKYAKIYMRADTKKTDIKRKYQKLMEFYADASSLLVALYEILIIVLGFINTFYAEYAISNKLFLFKEIEGAHFDISKNTQKIKSILSSTGNYSDKINNIELFQIRDTNVLESIKESSNEEIVLYDKNKTVKPNQNIRKSNIIVNPKIKKRTTITKKIRGIRGLDLMAEDSQKAKMKSNSLEIGLKFNQKDKKEENLNSPENLTIEERIKYSFNICEVIKILLFSCCMRKKLKVKNELNAKAINILDNKLDIVLYVRNMLLFDIINETIIDETKKSVINFLCRPILSINEKEDDKFSEFYQNYKEKDFELFSLGIFKLIQKYPKEEREKKLIELCHKHLKNFE